MVVPRRDRTGGEESVTGAVQQEELSTTGKAMERACEEEGAEEVEDVGEDDYLIEGMWPSFALI